MPSSLEPSSSTPGKKPATATIAQSGTLNVFLSISNSTPWIIDSEDQANDIFTKAEYKGTFLHLHSKLGIKNIYAPTRGEVLRLILGRI